ncbi:MAG: hypothetical protein ABW046_07240, partial [Actinoplanes sp.]
MPRTAFTGPERRCARLVESLLSMPARPRLTRTARRLPLSASLRGLPVQRLTRSLTVLRLTRQGRLTGKGLAVLRLTRRDLTVLRLARRDLAMLRLAWGDWAGRHRAGSGAARFARLRAAASAATTTVFTRLRPEAAAAVLARLRPTPATAVLASLRPTGAAAVLARLRSTPGFARLGSASALGQPAGHLARSLDHSGTAVGHGAGPARHRRGADTLATGHDHDGRHGSRGASRRSGHGWEPTGLAATHRGPRPTRRRPRSGTGRVRTALRRHTSPARRSGGAASTAGRIVRARPASARSVLGGAVAATCGFVRRRAVPATVGSR